MLRFFIFLGFLLSLELVAAEAVDCRRGGTGESVSLESIAAEVPERATVFFGELHGFQQVASLQIELLQHLRRQGHSLDVGMEFFSYGKQGDVDLFVQGLIEESDFLGRMGWGKGTPFEHYRQQILFPKWVDGERTWAINAPRSLTAAVAKRGIDGLSADEKALLPPQFQLGRDEYFQRFQELMGEHTPKESLLRYLQAQSVWDDTMAWQLALHRGDKTQFVVVGEFHVQYGGGLPDRYRLRTSGGAMVSIGVVNREGLSEAEVESIFKPHPQWGIREDFICLVQLPEPGVPLLGGLLDYDGDGHL